tara:strand:+ start:172 stop:720 length:549 start_codon:yes stop_codon:yes gene_type:complete
MDIVESVVQVIEDGKVLGRRIKSCIKAVGAIQDRVHELVVSAMYHYWLHGDSTYLTQLAKGITKCQGVQKQKLTGYITETCGVNWDTKNLRFKKAKDSIFTKANGNEEFPLEILSAERWYEFELDNDVPTWYLKKVLQRANKSIADNESDARAQVGEAWSEFEALQKTMREVGLSETFVKAA